MRCRRLRIHSIPISLAFEKLLDDLFQDAAFDVSTDISVLQMMLAREGYKEKDFK